MSTAVDNAQTGPSVERLRVEAGGPLADGDLPKVAIIIPTLDGLSDIKLCLASLSRSDYPKELVQIIVVDNASTDDTVGFVRGQHPAVRVIANQKNNGFAPATNQGVAAAEDASVLVFLNNDVRVEERWLREIVAPIVRGECAATGAKMLSWDGATIDHAGGGSNFHGVAVAYGYKRPPGPEHEYARKCLFACGGAMAMDAKLYREMEGFDDEYFAYFEDLDLGWRTWVQGHEVHYAPKAIGFHHHSGTSRRFPAETMRLIQIRNSLLTCFKNYEAGNFERFFPALLALAVRRMWIMTRLYDDRAFRVEHIEQNTSFVHKLRERVRKHVDDVAINRIGAADMLAINDLLGNWNHWHERRATVQAGRRRPDTEIAELFLKPLWCVEGDPGYIELQSALLAQCGIEDLFRGLTYAGEEPLD